MIDLMAREENAMATKQEHASHAERIMILAYANSRAHSKLAQLALARYGEKGAMISGVVQDHFPDTMKDTLRTIAHRVTTMLDESRYHWRKARKQHRTWMRLKDQIISRHGKGYYG